MSHGAALPLGILAVLLLAVFSSSHAATTPHVGPVADWIDDTIRELSGLAGDTGSALTIVIIEGGELDQFSRSELAGHLNRAEARIDTFFDPTMSPSLDPVDAGVIDASVCPATLEEYAETCATLSMDAFLLSLTDPVPCEDIGTKLKTIRSLLPQYRHLAGIQ